MNREQLSDAIGRLDEELVGAAMAKRRRPWWVAAVAVAACVALVIGAVTVWPTLTGEENRPPLDVATQPTTVTTDRVDGWPTDATLPEDTTANTTPSDTTAPTTTAKPADKTTTAKPTDKTTTAKPVQKTTKKTTARPTATQTPVLTGSKLLAAPKYPTMAKRPGVNAGGYGYEDEGYDAWKNHVKRQQDQIKGQTDGMTDFYRRTINIFLDDESGENRVYSPLNVYVALSMLAETAEGESRQQILNLLGVSKLSTLRNKNAALWNGVYMDDGAVLCRLANSLWLSKDLREQYNKTTIEGLAKYYYASVYEGKMGSQEYNQVLRDWLNEQTDGLLKQQVGSLRFERNTVMALSSTICFKAKWYKEFDAEKTEKGIFYTSRGEKSCYYLREETHNVLWQGDRFTSLSLTLDDDYSMIFFRPDEGVTANELIRNEQVLEVMQGNLSNVEEIWATINMSIPKFDVVSDLELSAGLKALGVTDVFDVEKSNFGGAFKDQDALVWLEQVQHAARVKIDEEGVTAVAYTIMIKPGAAKPKEPIEFKLDRPFVFAITGPGNTILFTGVVENP